MPISLSRLFRLLPSMLIASMAFVLALPQQAHAQADDEKVAVSAISQRPTAHPGDTFAVAVRFKIAEHLHIWPSKAEKSAATDGTDIIETKIEFIPNANTPKWLKVYPAFAQWPAPEEVTVQAGKVKAYENEFIVFVPVVIDPSAPTDAAGRITFDLKIRYQACDATTCFRAENPILSVPLTIVAMDKPAPPVENDTFRAFDQSVFSRVADLSDFDFLGIRFQVGSNSYALILLIALAAGVLMNFTPCVIPVIPIKILSIQAHANSPGKLAYFGTLYCLGIITLYIAIGVLFVGLIEGVRKLDWGQLFTYPAFTITMALIVGIMGVGLMGLFTFRLPNFVYAVNPVGEKPLGNYVGGILTGILAVPCTGPLLGATIAWIATQPKWLGMATFVVMGIGMALPYALLVAFPSLLKKMPKGGPGGELMKQVMGAFLIVVAAFMAGNLTSAKWPWFIVGATSAFACIWWIKGSIRMLRTPKARVINVFAAVLVMFGLGYMVYSLTAPPPVDWRMFVNEKDTTIMAAIKAETAKGKVVIIDFTAKWCTNCHVIERNVLYSAQGLATINSDLVTPMKVDLTNSDQDQGWGTVREISGGGGVPLIAVFGPGAEKPIYFQSFFGAGDLAAAVAKVK